MFPSNSISGNDLVSSSVSVEQIYKRNNVTCQLRTRQLLLNMMETSSATLDRSYIMVSCLRVSCHNTQRVTLSSTANKFNQRNAVRY